MPGRSDLMGEADAEDDANRDLWRQCIDRHRGAVLCLRRIRAVGGLKVEEVREP